MLVSNEPYSAVSMCIFYIIWGNEPKPLVTAGLLCIYSSTNTIKHTMAFLHRLN